MVLDLANALALASWASKLVTPVSKWTECVRLGVAPSAAGAGAAITEAGAGAGAGADWWAGISATSCMGCC